jgi:hypothetical protein
VSTHVRERLFEYISGETTAEENAAIAEHLAQCAACREDRRILGEAMDLLPARGTPPSDSLDDQFWASFPARVEERINAGRKSRTSFIDAAADRIASFVHFNRAYLLGGSGALALAAIAVILFRGTPTTGPVQGAGPEAAREVMLEPAGKQLHNYLKKSRVLLVGVSNLRMDGDAHIDLSIERRQSRELVHEARDLKKQAMDPRSARLVGDLEKILIELANSDESHNGPDVEIIRSGIRHNNLLFKVRMTESALAAATYGRNSQ